MNPFKSILEKFRKVKARLTQYRETNGYVSKFRSFGSDPYKSDLVRACIRPLADQTSKADPECRNKQLENMLRYSPNQFMSGKDFLAKIRTQYELYNTAVVIIFRDGSRIEGFYPISYQSVDGLEDPAGNLYLKVYTAKGDYIFDWRDVVVLRKDYNSSDLVGDSNEAVLETLEMINTSNQSIANAVKATANLRGIIKSTKAMLDPDDLQKQKEAFVSAYMDPTTGDGIGALDATQEFIPIDLKPMITNFSTMKELREDLYRYFGVNDDIVMAKATPEQMQVFYELRIEPFLIALSQEMTRKVYSDREIAFGNKITFASSTIQFMSMSEKLALKDFMDRGAIAPNTWCDIVGLPHVEGGDKPIRRLDTAPVDQVAKSVEQEQDEESE